MGISPTADGTPPSQQLQDPRVRNAVSKLLTWAIHFFEGYEKIKKVNDNTAVGGRARALAAILPWRYSSLGIVRQSLAVVATGIQQGSPATIVKVRWAFSAKGSRRNCCKSRVGSLITP